MQLRLRLPRISLGLDPENKRMFWGMFFNEAGVGVFLTLWPLYIAFLGATPAQIGLVIGLWGFARLGFLLPSAMLIERFSTRHLILVTRIGAIVGFAIMSISQTWWHLLPGVLLMSASTASFPVISSVIAEVAGRGRARARAFTMILNVGPSIALLVTPALGGILAETVSLRGIFVAATLLNVAGFLVFWGMQDREVRIPTGPPVTYTEVFRDSGTRSILFLAFVVVFAMVIGVTLVPNLLQQVHDVPIGQIGYLGSLAAVGSISLGMMLSKIRALENSMLAFSLAVGTVAGCLALLVLGGSIWLFALAFVLRGGLLATFSVMYATLSEVTPDRIRNRAYVVAEFMAGSGYALAPFLAGWLFGIQPELPMIAALAVLLPALAGTLFLSRRFASPAGEASA